MGHSGKDILIGLVERHSFNACDTWPLPLQHFSRRYVRTVTQLIPTTRQTQNREVSTPRPPRKKTGTSLRIGQKGCPQLSRRLMSFSGRICGKHFAWPPGQRPIGPRKWNQEKNHTHTHTNRPTLTPSQFLALNSRLFAELSAAARSLGTASAWVEPNVSVISQKKLTDAYCKLIKMILFWKSAVRRGGLQTSKSHLRLRGSEPKKIEQASTEAKHRSTLNRNDERYRVRWRDDVTWRRDVTTWRDDVTCWRVLAGAA